MRREPAQQAPLAVRDRILQAARRRFSVHAYEDIGLWDIAADAGVDVACMYRCFGSQEELFARAVETALRPGRIFSEPNGLAASLARQVFAQDAAHAGDGIGPFDIVIRALSSPDGARVLRECIVTGFVVPLAGRPPHPSAQQAAAIAAFLGGLGILRNVLALGSLREPEGGALHRLIERTLQAILEADDGRAPRAAMELRR
ncbi:TetR family transcriptional regulator [Siccirubricoccus sp. KC 17139]|uniref:TetR family transcriptional regulator n=1 Tax=Siccirubricoccus soli TaxID=2899147 RepID=A0ABT1DF74_9PROT|nr:TetR/AcrR family transcriptional regulator [Siccirubricoccus soli]MCO6419610.1 TetR family transcriptional regulator [Siccirubricoccus soli]MCP2685745.1 TetR family transcriptional regulator [Siccirubricoccus soli]